MHSCYKRYMYLRCCVDSGLFKIGSYNTKVKVQFCLINYKFLFMVHVYRCDCPVPTDWHNSSYFDRGHVQWSNLKYATAESVCYKQRNKTIQTYWRRREKADFASCEQKISQTSLRVRAD